MVQLHKQDLNQILKLFTYNLIQRIDDLNNTQLSYNRNNYPYKIQDLNNFIFKYKNYQIVQQSEFEYIHKFAKRLLQIFNHFRKQSSHADYLCLFQKRFQKEIKDVIKQPPVLIVNLLNIIKNYSSRNFTITQIKIGEGQSQNQLNKPSSAIRRSADTSTSMINIKKQEEKNKKSMKKGRILKRNKSIQEYQSQKNYDILDLDKQYMQRKSIFSFVLNKEILIERIQKDLFKKNEKIQADIIEYTKKYFFNKKYTIFTTNGSKNLTKSIQKSIINTADNSILLQIKNGLQPSSQNKKLLHKHKPFNHIVTNQIMINNWFPRKKKYLQCKDSSTIQSSHNFCNKSYHGRALKKTTQQQNLQNLQIKNAKKNGRYLATNDHRYNELSFRKLVQ